MKLTTTIFLIFLMLGLIQNMSVRQNAHENLKNHHNKILPLSHNDEYDSGWDNSDSEGESENEQHLQDPASAAAAAAATEATKFLMNNPEAAAQIPTKMITGKINGLISTFEGAWNLKDRARSLQLTFTNLIQQRIVYDSDYFDSGTWYRTWQPQMEWFSINQGEVANKQGSFFTGVTGGIKLRILAGNGKPEGYIYLGFNNPYSGSYKFFAEVSSVNRPARYGYDQSVNNSPKNAFGLGYRVQVVQTPSSIAQMAFVYQISYA